MLQNEVASAVAGEVANSAVAAGNPVTMGQKVAAGAMLGFAAYGLGKACHSVYTIGRDAWGKYKAHKADKVQ